METKNSISGRAWWRNLKPLALVLFLVGLINCAPDEVCITENDTRVKISFKQVIYPDTDSAFLQNDTLIFSRITALLTDSVFVVSDTLTSTILPVNTGADVTVFILDSDQGNDTLELRYKRLQRLISVDCGPEQVIDNLEAGLSTFDSLGILFQELSEKVTTNVEIYR